MKILKQISLRKFGINHVYGSKSICVSKAAKRIDSEQNPQANQLLRHESFVSN